MATKEAPVKRGRLLGVDRVKVTVETGPDSLVQQQFKDEVDINNIVRRFGLEVSQRATLRAGGIYGDFSEITDFESALAAIERAEDNFMALPPEAREKFANDPARFLDYAQRVTDDQLAEFLGARLLGSNEVVPPVAPPAPPPAPPAPPPPSA